MKPISIIGCLIAVFGCGRLTAAPILSELPPGVHIVHLGHLENREIKEASGLAASRLRSDILWTINDSGNDPMLFAVAPDGKDRGSVRVNNAENIDWEDLASFEWSGQAYLLIGDVGDNRRMRDFATIYILKEPEIQGTRLPERLSVQPDRSIRFRFEGGPIDCESVSVDTDSRKIFLVSKRTVPPVLYQLPLFPSADRSLPTATQVAELRGMSDYGVSGPRSRNFFDYRQYQSAPTAMDIAPDGSSAAILTYNKIYLFLRNPGDGWARVFDNVPTIIPIPRLYQAEALCFGNSPYRLFFTSEAVPAPVYGVDLDVTGKWRQ